MDTQTLKENFKVFVQNKHFSSEEVSLREKGLENFSLPIVNNEEWHYTPLSVLKDQVVSEVLARNYIDQITKFKTDPLVYEICFVNGCYIEKFSNLKNLEVTTLNQRVKNISHNLKWFEALNLAFFENGISIYLKKNQVVEKPILIRHYFNTQAQNYMASPRVLVIAEDGAEANITEIFEDGSNANYFVNDVIEFNLDKNSKINYLRLVNESANAVHTGHINASLEQDSTFDSMVVGLGSKLSRHQQKIYLNAKSAEANLKGIALLNETRFEQNIDITHMAPTTMSNQDFKFILNGKSRGVFQGKVEIKSLAQQSSAQQLNKNLLLDKKSHMDTKPQLDVYADDVKATHGATVGHLDEEEKFYLQSRGLSLEEASRMLCEGFVFSTAQKLKNKWQREHLLHWLKVQL